MKKMEIKFGDMIISISKNVTASGNKKVDDAIDKFKYVKISRTTCLEEYKVFSGIDWLGDDDADADTVWDIVCDYICSVLGLTEYEYILPFSEIKKAEKISGENIKELENF